MTLADRAVEIAISEVGVREVGRNRGQRIEEYLATVHLDPGDPWCAAFVAWCFARAAAERGVSSPVPGVGAVNKLWRQCPATWRQAQPTVGAIFIHFENPENPYSHGHTGLVVSVEDSLCHTVEGNTDNGGSREGDGVYRRVRDKAWINVGCIAVPDGVGVA